MHRRRCRTPAQRNSVTPDAALFRGEVHSLPALFAARFCPRHLPVADRGNGEPVLVLPGFCAADETTRQLRLNLRDAGFDVRGWGLGRNWGARIEILDGIQAAVGQFAADRGRPVHLLGWSLGGVMARECAKLMPSAVASVISMGSPIAGSPRDNHMWRIYEQIAGHRVDAPPIAVDLLRKPPMPTYALWSRRDGIVAAHAARGGKGGADVVREVDCTHIGFATDVAALTAVIDCLTDAAKRMDAGTVTGTGG